MITTTPARIQGARQLLQHLADWDSWTSGQYELDGLHTCAVGHLIVNHLPTAEQLLHRRGEHWHAAKLREIVARSYGLTIEDVESLEQISDLSYDCDNARFEIAAYFGLGN